MSDLFQIYPLTKLSFMQRLLKQYPVDNAIIEINNLLASKDISKISINEINAITSKYRVNLQKTFPANLEEFYAVYLNHCLKDRSLSKEEIKDLKLLKGLLGLTDSVVNLLHNSISGFVYRMSLEEAVKDGRLDDEEKAFLEKLKNEVQLDNNIAQKISEEVRGNFVKQFINKVTSDQMLSPDEELELNAISSSLNVDIINNQKNRAYLDKLKLLWSIENKELQSCEVDINLQKNEVCYYYDFVEWHEERRKQWQAVDRGNVYLTNKRVLFMGESKNTNIRLDKILSCSIHSNGVEIDKEAGKVPILRPKANADLMGKILKRIIRDLV